MPRSGEIPFLSSLICLCRMPPRMTGPICPGRSSDSRIILLAAPSHPKSNRQWLIAAVVPFHSGGSVPDSHRIPFWPVSRHLNCSLLSESANKRQGEKGGILQAGEWCYAKVYCKCEMQRYKTCGCGNNRQTHEIRSRKPDRVCMHRYGLFPHCAAQPVRFALPDWIS